MVKSKRSRTNPGRVVARGEGRPGHHGTDHSSGEDEVVWTTLREMTLWSFLCRRRPLHHRSQRQTCSPRSGEHSNGSAGSWGQSASRWLELGRRHSPDGSMSCVQFLWAAHPPIGTAPGGPTALGCLVMMAMTKSRHPSECQTIDRSDPASSGLCFARCTASATRTRAERRPRRESGSDVQSLYGRMGLKEIPDVFIAQVVIGRTQFVHGIGALSTA